DADTTGRIVNILKNIDMSYIFISHNIDFISQTTNKIYGMADGRIFQEGRPVIHAHDHSHEYGQLPHTHSRVKS
ncbi:MAG: ABC transporter ATP-binding protein, partial [Pseudomonadota bacterium]